MENTNRLFLEESAKWSEEDVIEFITREFQTPRDSVSCFEFIVVFLEDGGWEGSAYFLMKHRETGDFYEASGSHCSCFGFEEQWDPKIAPKAYLVSEKYSPWYVSEKDNVKQFVKQLFT